MDDAARTAEPSDAVLTVPNLLTFFRLALLPVFLWLALGPDRLDLAVIVAFVGFLTDLADGRIARRYGQVTRLGILLDPLADRLGIAAGAVALIVHDLAPLWAVILVVARDALLVLVGGPLLRSRHVEIPPVSTIGKLGSLWTSMAWGLFIGAGWFDAADPIRGVQVAAWVLYAAGVPLYYAASVGYARAGIRALGSARRPPQAGR